MANPYAWIWELNLDEVTTELKKAAAAQEYHETTDRANLPEAVEWYRNARGRFGQLGGDIHSVFPPTPPSPPFNVEDWHCPGHLAGRGGYQLYEALAPTLGDRAARAEVDRRLQVRIVEAWPEKGLLTGADSAGARIETSLDGGPWEPAPISVTLYRKQN